jgi:hypothetical protein
MVFVVRWGQSCNLAKRISGLCIYWSVGNRVLRFNFTLLGQIKDFLHFGHTRRTGNDWICGKYFNQLKKLNTGECRRTGESGASARFEHVKQPADVIIMPMSCHYQLYMIGGVESNSIKVFESRWPA